MPLARNERHLHELDPINWFHSFAPTEGWEAAAFEEVMWVDGCGQKKKSNPEAREPVCCGPFGLHPAGCNPNRFLCNLPSA